MNPTFFLTLLNEKSTKITSIIRNFKPAFLQEVHGLLEYEGFYIDYESFKGLCESINETALRIPNGPTNDSPAQMFMQNPVNDIIFWTTDRPFSNVILIRRGDD